MINTVSAWNFGHTIISSNKYINFEELGATVNPKAAILNDGSYTLEEYCIELVRALNDAAELNKYTYTLDRTTRKITLISDAVNFSLLIATGDQSQLSSFPLAGFTGLDLSGAMMYEGDSPSGEQFIPQFKLQEYTPFEDLEKTANASVNENTQGDIIEVINYGTISRMKCNIMFQTNHVPQNAIREDAQGVDKLRTFMRYLITKAKTEFLEDIDQPSTIVKCILDKTTADSKGLGYELVDMRNVGWTNYFTTKSITFRKVS